MKDIIKVKVVLKGIINWYKVGEIYEVESPAVDKWNSDIGSHVLSYVLSDNSQIWLRAEHCEIVQPTLQEQLQSAKDNVVAIEKQLAEEAKREANKPFYQQDYERVVAQFRKCAGRKVFESYTNNWCAEISIDSVGYDSYQSWISFAMFGVWFDSVDSVENAIKEVGEDNLRKAWSYEMSIGLGENV